MWVHVLFFYSFYYLHNGYYSDINFNTYYFIFEFVYVDAVITIYLYTHCYYSSISVYCFSQNRMKLSYKDTWPEFIKETQPQLQNLLSSMKTFYSLLYKFLMIKVIKSNSCHTLLIYLLKTLYCDIHITFTHTKIKLNNHILHMW